MENRVCKVLPNERIMDRQRQMQRFINKIDHLSPALYVLFVTSSHYEKASTSFPGHNRDRASFAC